MNSAQRGAWGEGCAVAALQRCGARVVARNWRWRRCELDVVAVEGGVTVFAEVKVRAVESAESGWASIDARKQHRLMCAGEAFLRRHREVPAEARFDLVLITGHPREFVLQRVCDVLGPVPTALSPAIFTPK
jgi:putative endonuclease